MPRRQPARALLALRRMQKRITDSFIRGLDGRWTCVEPVTLKYPPRLIQVRAGTTWGPEDCLMGVKIAKLLDACMDTRRACS